MRITIETSPIQWPRILRAVGWVLLVLAAIWGLTRVWSVLVPFLIAFFIASLLDPVVVRLQARGLTRGRAVAAIFALGAVVLLGGSLILGRAAMPQMMDLASKAPTISSGLTERVNAFYERNRDVLDRLGIRENPLSAKSGPLATGVSGVLNSMHATLAGAAGQVLWLVLIPLAVIYFLIDYPAIRGRLIAFVPEKHQRSVDRMSVEVVEIFSGYVRSLTKMCVLYGLVAALLFLALGLHYALFLGCAAGVLYAVPYVGPALALLAAVLVALTMGKTLAVVILTAVLFGAMHVTFDQVITPRVVGGAVGLHPLVNIMALMCGATLFGVWGMLLAVPVAASLQMLLFYFCPHLAQKPPAPACGVVAPEGIPPEPATTDSPGPHVTVA